MLESQYVFSSSQSVAGAVTTGAFPSDNVIDVSGLVRDIAPGVPLYIVTLVTTALVSTGTTANLAVVLQTCSTAGGTYLPAPVVSNNTILFGATGTAATIGSGLTSAGVKAGGGTATTGGGGQLLQIMGTCGTAATNTIMAAGVKYVAAISPGAIPFQWCRLAYVPMSVDISSGNLTTFITKDPQWFKGYASGFSVL